MSRQAEEQEAVQLLGGWMEAKLRDNAFKPHWNTESNDDLIMRALEEMSELNEALQEIETTEDRDAIKAAIEECADVANFMAMICHNLTRGHI